MKKSQVVKYIHFIYIWLSNNMFQKWGQGQQKTDKILEASTGKQVHS